MKKVDKVMFTVRCIGLLYLFPLYNSMLANHTEKTRRQEENI